MSPIRFDIIISAGRGRSPLVREGLPKRKLYAVTADGGRPGDNQDGFLLGAGTRQKIVVLGVGDGMGGHSNGAIACDLGLEGLEQKIKALRSKKIPAQTPLPGYFDFIDGRLRTFNQRVQPRTLVENAGTAMACLICYLDQGVGYAGSWGDVAVVQTTPGGTISLLMPFNSQANTAWHETNQLKMGQAFPLTCEPGQQFSVLKDYYNSIKSHPLRSKLSCFIGNNFGLNIPFWKPFFQTLLFQPGDRFYLFSDGLLDAVEFEVFAGILRADLPLPETLDALLAASSQSSDNVTVGGVEV